MSDLKISQMTPASSVTGSDFLPIVQGGINKRASINQIEEYVNATLIDSSSFSSYSSSISASLTIINQKLENFPQIITITTQSLGDFGGPFVNLSEYGGFYITAIEATSHQNNNAIYLNLRSTYPELERLYLFAQTGINSGSTVANEFGMPLRIPTDDPTFRIYPHASGITTFRVIVSDFSQYNVDNVNSNWNFGTRQIIYNNNGTEFQLSNLKSGSGYALFDIFNNQAVTGSEYDFYLKTTGQVKSGNINIMAGYNQYINTPMLTGSNRVNIHSHTRGGVALFNGTTQTILVTGSNVIIGTGSSGNEKLQVNGNVRVTSLSGSGFRMVIADATGSLFTQEIPSPVISLNSSNTGFYSDAIGAVNPPSGSTYFGLNAGSGSITHPIIDYFNGEYSFILGNNAGSNVIGFVNSFFIGNDSARNSTLLSNTICIGNNSGENSSDASSTNMIGFYAGANSSESFNSNFIGESAGNTAISSFESNFIGYSSGENSQFSPQSNFIGFEAGNSNENSKKSNFIGFRAGKGAISSSNSIFIGTHVGYELELDSSNKSNNSETDWSICIGRNLVTGGKKNSILIGGNNLPDGGFGNVPSNLISSSRDNQFMLSPSIINAQFRGVDYTFPSTQGNSGSIMVNDGSGNLSWSQPKVSTTVPTSISSSGVTGTIAADSNYVYVCVASNQWKRAALSNW